MTATAAPRAGVVAAPVEELRRIPLAELHESPLNPRKHFDADALAQLKESLLASGQLEPVLVRPRKAGGYELAAGHRRYRAAKLAWAQHAAGAAHRRLHELLAIVREMDDRTFVETLNIDNLQRDDLHLLEEAQGFKDLMTECGYDVKKIAARIGKSDRYVYDSLTLLKLIPEAKKLFLSGAFERGHAIILARLSAEHQRAAIDKGNAEVYASKGGLWQSEYAHADPDLTVMELDDLVKPVSVRELQTWVDNNVRMVPEIIDPVLFPETAEVLAQAKQEEIKVVHITHDYRVPDAARDEKQRTYGAQAWKRADGSHKSKKCEYAVIGVVVAGPGQGDAFRVCVRKDKCKTHWAAEHRQRMTGQASSHNDEATRYEAKRQAEDQERDRWKRSRGALLKAIADQIKKIPVTPCSALGRFYLDRSWGSVRKYLPAPRHAEDMIRYMVFAELEEDVTGWVAPEQAARDLKQFGIDAKKIVDQIAPKPKAEKKQAPAKKPAKKKARK